MSKPCLVRFRDLRAEDFEHHPVWASCHSFDLYEPWFEETDEETFRPWEGHVPIDPEDGLFLVRATMTFADGRRFPGFLTPVHPEDEGDLELLRPHLFAKGLNIGFWSGVPRIHEGNKASFDAALGTGHAGVFPIEARCDVGLADGVCVATLEGFYHWVNAHEVVVER
ncbi:MAG: hypothetical protein R3F30_01460 [Planctomycetota bacterium]